MKTKPFLAVMCVFLLGTTGFTQPPPKDDFNDQFLKIANKARHRSNWNGSLELTLQLLINPELREAWGVSEEQYQQIEDIRSGKIANPEYLKIRAELSEQLDGLRGAELATKTLEIQQQRSPLDEEFRARAMDDLLTAEQKRTIREFQLVDMLENRFISFHAFEAFDLTDAQKQELEVIKKEYEPEFERQLEEFVNHEDIALQLWTKIQLELRRQGGDPNVAIPGTKRNAIHEKLLAEDPEYKKMHAKNVAQKELIATHVKTVIFDVLTDEQWNRFQELMDNPPEYIKAWHKKIKGTGEAAQKDGGWVPGPGAWQPGQGIPEGFRQERNERRGRGFPREAN